MSVKSFTIYDEYYQLITLLNREEQKELLLAITEYMFIDKIPTLNDNQMKIFKNLKRPLDISKKRSKNGSKKITNENQNEIKLKSNQNQNEIKTKTHHDVNVNVNVNVYILIEYIENKLGILFNELLKQKIEILLEYFDIDILKYAVDITAERHKGLNYFFAIARNWKQDGIKTLSNLKKKKVIPEWFDKEIESQVIEDDDFKNFIEVFRSC